MKAEVNRFSILIVGTFSCGFLLSIGLDNRNIEGTNLLTELRQNASEVGNEILGVENDTSTSSSNNQSTNLVLLSHKLKDGNGIFNEVIGEVKNIGNDTIEFVKIGVNVYDKNGDIVGTDSTYAQSSTLKPNQKSSFNIISSKDNFEGMDSYELTLSWQTPDGIDEYIDNAQIYETGQNGSDEQDGSEVGNNILENTEDAADEINKNAKKAVDKIEDLD